MRLEYILEQAINSGASDVHIVVGVPPTMRLNGELRIMEMERLSADKAKDLVWGFMTPDQAALFQKDREMNLSFNIPGLSYFRMNLYYRMGNVEAAIRIIPLKIPSLNELGLPSIIGELTRRKSGLILITGSAGMGKTTTMAAMINLLNQEERHARVLTIEDPIEYVHPVINSIIIQREICRDPDDTMILATAKAGNAQFIVTGDEDLLVLRKFENTLILSPRDFWKMLTGINKSK